MEDALLPLTPVAYRTAPPSGNCSSFAPKSGSGRPKERQRQSETTLRAGRLRSNCDASLRNASLCAKCINRKLTGKRKLAGIRSIGYVARRIGNLKTNVTQIFCQRESYYLIRELSRVIYSRYINYHTNAIL